MFEYVRLHFERADTGGFNVDIGDDAEIMFPECRLWPRELKLVYAIAKVVADANSEDSDQS